MLARENNTYLWYFTSPEDMILIANLTSNDSCTPIGWRYTAGSEGYYHSTLDYRNNTWENLGDSKLINILYGTENL